MKKINLKLIIIMLVLIFFLILAIRIFLYIKNNFSIYKIQTGSMIPEINIGEIILVFKNDSYEEDDIITYKMDNNYFVTHRIIKKLKNGYITKGDLNNIEDKEVVKEEQIQGKVILHSKVLGKIYEFKYFIIILLIIAILM